MIHNFNWLELWESLLRIIKYITSNYLAIAPNTPSPNSSGTIPQVSEVPKVSQTTTVSGLSDATQSQLLNILSLSSQVRSSTLIVMKKDWKNTKYVCNSWRSTAYSFKLR